MFVSVVLNNTAREYDKCYDYRVPKNLESYIQPGIRVLVPFGRSGVIREAFVMEVKEESSFKGIKDVYQLVDETPVLSPELLKLCQFMKKRYICTYDLSIRCMIPAGLGLLYRREVVLCQEEIPLNQETNNETQQLSAAYREHSTANESKAMNQNIGGGVTPKKKNALEQNATGNVIPQEQATDGTLNLPAHQACNHLNAEEMEIIDILQQHNGRLFIDQLQGLLKKPIMKSLKMLEEKNYIYIVNRFQMKARAKTEKVIWPAMENEEYQEMVLNNRIRSMNYLRVMEMLYEEGGIPANELNMLGFSMAILKNMEKKGFVFFTEEPVERNPLDEVDVQKTEPMSPTPCQKEALSVILEALQDQTCNEILLHGITGSGKTEVYLQVIQEVIRQGKTAILLVPEIGLTPQTVRQFKGRFGDSVAVLHSRLSMGERFDQWNKIKDGAIKVVIGARSAVFAPLDNIGIIIIDEEHETSYKSDRTPKYDARTIAAARSRFHNGLVLYGSATPSVENYYRAVTGKIKLVEMLERTNNHPLPEVLTVDMREEMDKGLRNEFSKRLIRELQQNKVAGEQSILFINRRGHSNYVLCRKCGFIATCPYCSISLTWHQNEKRLVCHYCSYATTKPDICPKCKAHALEPHGLGTQKVEQMLPCIEPGFSVIRMDLDTTSGRHGHQKVLDAFRERKHDVMVGTQMIAKGHDFSEVTLVGILNADSLLGSGDYRASERTFQLITQASGRAGRAKKQGRVVLQTYNPDEFSIQAAIRQDYKAFFKQEISLRKRLQLPPYYHFGIIQISGKDRALVEKTTRRIHSEIVAKKEFNTGMFLSEPAPSPVLKMKNRFRWRVVLKHPSIKALVTVLEWVYDTYGSSGKKQYVVSVDINPASMI